MGLYAVKVLDASGNGYISDVIEGLQWSINNGMQIANMSFGMSTDSPSLHEAIQAANNASVILITSAGNLGPQENSVTYPAKYQETIAVSALDEFDNIAPFSSTGPEIDFVAPGANILSSSNNGAYQGRSVTSMSAPHVTGTAALALSVKGVMSPSALKVYLIARTEDLGLALMQQGVGLVDAQAVVQP